MISKLQSRLCASLLALLLLGAACDRAAPDDQGFHAAVQSRRTGAEVTMEATVRSGPEPAGAHEHLLVTATTGEVVEIDHNTTLASWVPARTGDHLVVHGQLYIDPGRIGIHCTHAKTTRGCPEAGWIKLGSDYYQ